MVCVECLRWIRDLIFGVYCFLYFIFQIRYCMNYLEPAGVLFEESNGPLTMAHIMERARQTWTMTPGKTQTISSWCYEFNTWILVDSDEKADNADVPRKFKIFDVNQPQRHGENEEQDAEAEARRVAQELAEAQRVRNELQRRSSK